MDIPKISMRPEDISSEISYFKQYSVKETYPLHSHDFYELFYITNGKAIHNINSENQLLSKGSLVFIRPFDTHKYSFFNHFDMEIISCGFFPVHAESAFFYLQLNIQDFLSLKLPPHIILSDDIFRDVEQKLDLIPTKQAGRERRQYFLSLLPELIYLFNSEIQHNTTILPVWLTRLLEQMEQSDHYISGLDTMLSLTNISQEHLTREFRKHLGITPTEFINTKRINYAAELLLQRKYEILDVCYMSGFNNLSHFYEIFKKQYCCTPKQFLKKYMPQ